MDTIKFDHYYQKMPSRLVFHGAVHEVWQVFICDRSELGKTFAKWDTAYLERGKMKYAKLPEGKLIVVVILSSNYKVKQSWSWMTIRSWSEQKELDYRRLIGQKVNIEIKGEENE